jgi:hypothetical protein
MQSMEATCITMSRNYRQSTQGGTEIDGETRGQVGAEQDDSGCIVKGKGRQRTVGHTQRC